MSNENALKTKLSIDEMLKEYPPDHMERIRNQSGYSFTFRYDNFQDWVAVKERVLEGFDRLDGWCSASALFFHDNEALMDLIQFREED